MTKQVLIKIYGQVQGIGFRYQAFIKARKLNIKGYAQNIDDGSLEILAQGEEDRLKEMIGWARVGPENAKVEKIVTAWEKADSKFNDFEIK